MTNRLIVWPGCFEYPDKIYFHSKLIKLRVHISIRVWHLHNMCILPTSWTTTYAYQISSKMTTQGLYQRSLDIFYSILKELTYLFRDRTQVPNRNPRSRITTLVTISLQIIDFLRLCIASILFFCFFFSSFVGSRLN